MRRTKLIFSIAAAALVAALALIAHDVRVTDPPAAARRPETAFAARITRTLPPAAPAVTAEGVLLPGTQLPAWSQVVPTEPTPPAPEHPVPPPPVAVATFGAH